MNKNLCRTVLEKGGTLIPLIIPSKDTQGLGLMNPSILNDNGKILVNLRSINYTLFHAEGEQRFNHRWGPLSYLNPENDVKLKTNNFVCLLDDQLQVYKHLKVDTTKLDKTPVWEFHGLEDARLIKWEEKLYLCGVRRDVKKNGEGRMELSELKIGNNYVKEISRFRIPDPNHEKTVYCNKNWAPINDIPYHFIKWVNPTEIVKINTKEKTCETRYTALERLKYAFDFRGGSQILSWGKYKLCLIHETCVFKNKLNQKDATYLHRFIVWNDQWKIIHVSDQFSFMTGMIEFSAGMCFHKGDLLITFGFQDNAAYLLKIPENMVNYTIGFPCKKFDYGESELFLCNMMNEEILEKKIYEKKYKVKKNDIVMDIGANVGIFTKSIFNKKPKHIYCIEPSKKLVKSLMNNIENNSVTIINKAIYYKTKQNMKVENGMYIYSNTDDRCDTITFRKLLKDNDIKKIDFLKVDCEGCEYFIFTKQNKDWISNNVGNIAAEFHLWGIPNSIKKFAKFRELYLMNYDYEAVSVYTGESLKKNIFDDKFLKSFMKKEKHSAQLMIYFNYE